MTPETETAHAIPARFDTRFEHTYPVEHPELRRLYENAKDALLYFGPSALLQRNFR